MRAVLLKLDLKHLASAICGALIVFSSTTGKAQTEDTDPIKYGVKAGLNVNSFGGAPHSGSNLGFSVGAFGSYTLSDIAAVQVEASYFQQGGTLTKFKDDTRFGAPEDFFTKNVTTSSMSLQNIEIPILFKVSLPLGEEIKPQFLIGPSVGINLRNVEKYSTTGELSNGVYVTAKGRNQVGNYERFQYGLNAGVGFEIPMGSVNLMLDARYRYGITAAKKSYSYINLARVSENITVNTVSFTFGVGF